MIDVPMSSRDERGDESIDAGVFGAIDSLAAAEDVVRGLGAMTGLSSWLFLRELDGEWVVLAAHTPDYEFLPGDSLGPHHPVVSPAPSSRQAVEDVVIDLSDVVDASLELESPDSISSIGSVIRIALRQPDGRTFARLTGLDPSPHPDPAALRRTRPALEMISGLLASLLTVDLDRSRMQRRVDAAESAALSDELTGLGNRRAFDRAIEREDARCERFGHRAGVLVLDLDGLKQVNDREGHAAGDHLIRRTADALRSSIRTADQAFRIGGDEFAVVLPEITTAGLDRVVERVRAELVGTGVAASIGAAIRGRGDRLTDAVSRADAAMYDAKRSSGC